MRKPRAMTDTPQATPSDVAADPVVAPTGKPAPAAKKPKKEEDWKDTASFIVKLVIVVVIFRSFLFSPFSIPSQSMLPRLYIGDYLFISKWNYGFSKHSLPFSVPLIPGRSPTLSPRTLELVFHLLIYARAEFVNPEARPEMRASSK